MTGGCSLNNQNVWNNIPEINLPSKISPVVEKISPPIFAEEPPKNPCNADEISSIMAKISPSIFAKKPPGKSPASEHDLPGGGKSLPAYFCGKEAPPA